MKILLVEDQETIAIALGALLSPDYELVWVDRVGKSFEALEKCPYQLLLLDLILPDSTDWRRTLQTIPAFKQLCPGMKVIVVSGAEPREEIEKQALRDGADNFISKGEEFTRRVIMMAIHSVFAIEAADKETGDVIKDVNVLGRISGADEDSHAKDSA